MGVCAPPLEGSLTGGVSDLSYVMPSCTPSDGCAFVSNHRENGSVFA